MFPGRWRLIFIMTAVFAAACGRTGLPKTGKADDPAMTQAAKSVEQFHARFNDGRYQEVCRISEAGAFAGASNLPCPDFLALMHRKLGAVVEVKPSTVPNLVVRPSSDTVRVALNYFTKFENGPAGEHFEWRVKGQQISLTSYLVNAPALSQ